MRLLSLVFLASTASALPPLPDVDNDGYHAGYDCNDEDPTVNPGATEVCGDGIDNDCDGTGDVDSDYFVDGDGDGYGSGVATTACLPPDGMVSTAGDCDDTMVDTYPGAPEFCDGRDTNCDGYADDDSNVAVPYYPDVDGDGEGDATASPTPACAASTGFVNNANDCDDADPSISTAGIEVCDGVDNDCDGTVDEEGVQAWYQDDDGDGFGNGNFTVISCTQPPGFSENDDDCDDSDPNVNPAVPEECGDGIDNNCDGVIEECGPTTGEPVTATPTTGPTTSTPTGNPTSPSETPEGLAGSCSTASAPLSLAGLLTLGLALARRVRRA